MDFATVARFVRDASQPRPYRFLHTLISDTDNKPPRCRKHDVPKVAHTYGPQLTVCPVCFPAEAVIEA